MNALSVQTRRFDVDPEVKDLERKLRDRVRTPRQKTTLALLWTLLSVAASIYWVIATVVISQKPPLEAAFTIVVLGVFLAAGVTLSLNLVRKSGTPEVDAINNERQKEQASIGLSREIAKSLGKAVVPALTKEHVDAGIRFDKAIDDHGVRWNRDNFQGVRSLLLEDLSREDTIVNLVTVRGMVTFPEVRSALIEMESNGKPLQDGWL